MNFPWTTRKQRRRREIAEKLTRERLACLRVAREAALRDVEAAKSRRDTRGQHMAEARAYDATHALRRAEMDL